MEYIVICLVNVHQLKLKAKEACSDESSAKLLYF